MREWIALIGTFSPILVIFFGVSGVFFAKSLWRLSLSVHILTWFCFLILCAGFYTGTYPSSGVLIQSQKLISILGPDSLFKWDYISSLLALSACTVLITAHFVSKAVFADSRAGLAAIAGCQMCLLGGLGSGSLFLFSIFLAGSLLPKFILVGLDESSERGSFVREIALLNIVSFLLLMVCVLVFSNQGNPELIDWFRLEGRDSIVRPGVLGFFLLVISSLLSAGLFPFHGSLRKIFLLDSLERSIFLSVQPIWGFLILFHFVPTLFPAELKEFSPILVAVFSAVLLLSSIAFYGAKTGRARLFWIQQVVLAFIAVGFFSLLLKGWHGALALLFFQSLAIPLYLMMMIFHKRFGGFNSLSEINNNRLLSLTTAISVLSLMGSPISIGFYGFLLVIWSLVGDYPVSLVFCVLAVPIYVSAGIRIMFFQISSGESLIDGRAKREPLADLFSVVPITVFLVCLGLFPKIIMGPMGNAAASLIAGLGIK